MKIQIRLVLEYSHFTTDYVKFVFGTIKPGATISVFISDSSHSKFVTESYANRRRWKRI